MTCDCACHQWDGDGVMRSAMIGWRCDACDASPIAPEYDEIGHGQAYGPNDDSTESRSDARRLGFSLDGKCLHPTKDREVGVDSMDVLFETCNNCHKVWAQGQITPERAAAVRRAIDAPPETTS